MLRPLHENLTRAQERAQETGKECAHANRHIQHTRFRDPPQKKPSDPSLEKTRDHNAWNSHEIALEVLFSFFRPRALSQRAIKRDLRPPSVPHLGFPMRVPVNYRLLETVTKEEFLEFSAKMSVHNERRWKATQAERRENKKYAEEKGNGKSKKTDRPGWVGGSVSRNWV